MQTFRDLQVEVLRWIDEPEDTNTTLTLVKDAINRSHRRVLSEQTWPFMRWPGQPSFTTVAGTRTYALKHGVSKILTLWDNALDVPTQIVPRREWEGQGISQTIQQGIPLGAIYGDVWPVVAQPASATITAVSSSASDTGGPTVIIAGLDSSGDAATETLTMTGTSNVVSSTSWSHVWAVTKTGTWVGTLTLTSGATTLLTLSATQYGKQYPTIEFIETPSSARTYLYTAQRTPSTLTNDYDIPDTPYPYAELHVWDALLDLTTYNTELGAKEQRLWRDRYEKLMSALQSNVDEGIAGSRPRFVRNLESSYTTPWSPGIS